MYYDRDHPCGRSGAHLQNDVTHGTRPASQNLIWSSVLTAYRPPGVAIYWGQRNTDAGHRDDRIPVADASHGFPMHPISQMVPRIGTPRMGRPNPLARGRAMRSDRGEVAITIDTDPFGGVRK